MNSHWSIEFFRSNSSFFILLNLMQQIFNLFINMIIVESSSTNNFLEIFHFAENDNRINVDTKIFFENELNFVTANRILIKQVRQLFARLMKQQQLWKLCFVIDHSWRIRKLNRNSFWSSVSGFYLLQLFYQGTGLNPIREGLTSTSHKSSFCTIDFLLFFFKSIFLIINIS
jgi:hypothetical protein